MNRSTKKSWWSFVVGSRIVWPLVALAMVLLFNAIMVPSFFQLQLMDGHLSGSLIDVLNRGSIGAVVAMGMTIVIATGGVDLSVGSVMAIAGGVAALLLTETDAGIAVVVGGGILAGIVAGLVNGVLVAHLKVQPIVATLILMVAGRGIAKFITGEKIITIGDDAFDGSFDFLGNGYWLGLPFPVIIFWVLLVITVVGVRRTSLGLFIEAVGANETASHAAGINTRLVKTSAYVFSSFCAAVAGLIATADIGAADTINAGVFSELDAIFAVVVGGTALTGGRFSLWGSVIGAILLQTLMTTLYTYGVASDVAPIPKALVVVTVCLLQSPRFRQQIMAGLNLRSAGKPNQYGGKE